MKSSSAFNMMLAVLSLAVAGCSNDTNNALKALDTGSYASVPDTVTLVIKGYKPQAGNAFQNIFVSNFSVKAQAAKLSYSTGRDSMSDDLKTSIAPKFGFQNYSPESVVTGFADLVLYQLGITTSQQSLMHCSSNQMGNSSNDGFVYNDDRLTGSPSTFLGLRDCEKVYLGLKPGVFDSAGNGIPDYMKLRCGINPLDKNAAYISTAGDGVSNLDKCKRNIPLDESANTQANQLFAYKYATQLNSDGTTDFTISNIPILNSGAGNFIAAYITETSTTGGAPSLYSAFVRLKSGSAGLTLRAAYWATQPSNYTNQEIQLQ